MIGFKVHRKKEHGLMVCAIGLGILLGVLLPIWWWMILSGIGLILFGGYWFRRC